MPTLETVRFRFQPDVEDTARDEAVAASSRFLAEQPGYRRRLVGETRLFAPSVHRQEAVSIDLAQVRQALREGRKLRIEYRDGEERLTRRTVRPLGLAFFGAV